MNELTNPAISVVVPSQVSGLTASSLRRPPAAGAQSRQRDRLLATQGGDLIFDAKLLAFKFGDYEVVGVRSVFLFVNEVLEFSMLGPQGFHVLCHGHVDPPISDRNITVGDANPSRQAL
jgi:hypothetical protein